MGKHMIDKPEPMEVPCYLCGQYPVKNTTFLGKKFYHKKCWIYHVNICNKIPIKYFCSYKCKRTWIYEIQNKKLNLQRHRNYKKAQQKEAYYDVV